MKKTVCFDRTRVIKFADKKSAKQHPVVLEDEASIAIDSADAPGYPVCPNTIPFFRNYSLDSCDRRKSSLTGLVTIKFGLTFGAFAMQ
jgi:hypothetical protein